MPPPRTGPSCPSRSGPTSSARRRAAAARVRATRRLPARGTARRRRSSTDAVGRELYALHSRAFLGSTVDLDETYAWGQDELARITAEMAVTADRIKPAPPSPRRSRTSTATARTRWTAPPALQEWMQGKSDAAVAALAGTHFDIPDEIRTLECRIAPTQQRRHLLHRPERRPGHPARPDVVVGAEGRHRVRHVARAVDRLPRGRARASPAGRADRLPARPAQPLAAAGVLGERARRGLGAVRGAADGRPRLPRRPGRLPGHARRAVAARGAGGASTSACTAGCRRRPRSAAASGPTTRPGSCSPRTRTCPRACCASSSTATWAGRARPRRTRSASGSGCSCAPTPRRPRGAAFDLREFHRDALNLGSVGLDVLRAAVLGEI